MSRQWPGWLGRLHRRLVQLDAWHDKVLGQWLEDGEYALGPAERNELSPTTGNWPLLLHRFYELSHEHKEKWPAALATIENELKSAEKVQELFAAFGLESKVVRPVRLVLQTMSVLADRQGKGMPAQAGIRGGR